MTSLERTRAVLRGERMPLPAGSTTVLKFMMDPPDGCDALIRPHPQKFLVQFGAYSSDHTYSADCGPPITSWLLDNVRAGVLPAGSLAYMAGMPSRWSYRARNVWIHEADDCITLMMRAVDHRAAHDGTPLPMPPRIELPPQYLAGSHPCPHCDVVPEQYRKLRDGSLICMDCGASHEPWRV